MALESLNNNNTMKKIECLSMNNISPNNTILNYMVNNKNVWTDDRSKLYEYYIDKGYGGDISPSPTYIKLFLDNICIKIKTISNVDKPESIDLLKLSYKISKTLPKTMNEDEFYLYISDYCIFECSYDIYYSYIASFISMERLHKITPSNILDVAKLLYFNLDVHNNVSPLISEKVYNMIEIHHEKIQKILDKNSNRDYGFDFFGIKTLERSYLFKIHHSKYKFVERPQTTFLRVAMGIHLDNIDDALETYDLMSDKYFTHATPTLFNAGTNRSQMSSCFLVGVEDSIEDIFTVLGELAFISKWAGGLGLHLTSIRARGSIIRKTNGESDGIVPLAVVINKLAKYINQGGKRKGSIACYLEPWHADIFEFCELRLNTGNDDNRARDLFLALWIPDLFMKRVEENGMWSLMCPDESPHLNTCHGSAFEELYTKYEAEGRYKKQVKAVDLWKHIMTSQQETGFPYTLFKDSANNKSNQKNLGTIRSSNLCTEIIQYSDSNETAVCNLASICLPRFIDPVTKMFNHEKLIRVCRVIVRNIDKIIDINYYPTEKSRRSNLRHRPMGIGVQGLADVYNLMGYPFDSDEALLLNKQIFETIYYGCLDESKELAKKKGHYETFKGSPFSQGLLQFHLWNKSEKDLLMGYDWNKLIEEIKLFGTRNSLLTTIMPTASTSQIMGNSEMIEPYMSNIFVRSTLAGEFIVVNNNLMNDLQKLGIWSEDIRKKLIIENGSVQRIDEIPQHIKDIYKTSFEIKQKKIIQQAADRGIFMDQSQSMNIFMAEPNFDLLNSILFTGWKLGLKTGMYYFRTLPAVNPINFGIDVEDIKRLTKNEHAMDLIKNGYNINENANIDNIHVAPNNTEQPKMCKWKPGVKLEDCVSCGS